MADEIDDDWLKDASREEQQDAIRHWFLSRYEDPANETPWDGEEKAYIFVWGGPYDPNDVIQERFGDIVEYEVMEEVIRDLHRDVGEQWAPIEHEGAEYEEHVRELVVYRRDDPYRFLADRLSQIDDVVRAGPQDGRASLVLRQMAHSSLIAALEAYLSDTFIYWIERDDDAFGRFLATNRDFQEKTLKLSELYARLDTVKQEVKTYLLELVWHRLAKVKELLVSAFEIEVPAIAALMKEIIRRHDIVHRAGRDKDGLETDITAQQLEDLQSAILKFARDIDTELAKRFPLTLDDERSPDF